MAEARSPLLELPNTYRAFYGRFFGLRDLQRAAIRPLLDGKDLVLQAATGSGKTEAVLAPCVERVVQAQRAHAVIYVVPTRALAGDLLRRVGPTLQRLGLSLAVRTGDVKRGGARPDVLITTPESLDVALGSPNAQIRAFLARVQSVILDEAHAYAGQRRGEQLRFLLHRLVQRTGALQRVALSATMVDLDAIVDALHLDAGATQLRASGGPALEIELAHVRDDRELLALIGDLHLVHERQKVLLFADSRRACERLYSVMNGGSVFRGCCELHYSNLSTRERALVESRFRESRRALCIATSTLELGIDIGDVDTVVLYGCPATASAFLQRAGRSGRRSGVRRVWGVVQGPNPGRQVLRFAGLIAMARAGHGETVRSRTYGSVLVQQVLSCVYEKGAVSPESLASLFPAHAEVLAEVLPAMQHRGWLRADRLGLLRGSWRYHDAKVLRRIWSNFPPEELPYSLVVDQAVVAELPAAVVEQLDPGDRVQLAGRRLEILEIDSGERREVWARNTHAPPTGEPVWAGLSAMVSLEAAQSVRRVLDGEVPERLMQRPSRLLTAELERPVAVLRNGLELFRTPAGTWRYRTLVGTLGNLVLREAIREAHPGFQVVSDGLGIDCSERVDFQRLSLPVGREAFTEWTGGRRRRIGAATPAGPFQKALPSSYQIRELVEILYDPRLDSFFERLRTESSDLLRGEDGLLIPTESPGSEAPVGLVGGGAPVSTEPRGCPPLRFERRSRLTAAMLARWVSLDCCPRHLAGAVSATADSAGEPPSLVVQHPELGEIWGQPHRVQTVNTNWGPRVVPELRAGPAVTIELRWRLAVLAWQLDFLEPSSLRCTSGIAIVQVLPGIESAVSIPLEVWLERLPEIFARAVRVLRDLDGSAERWQLVPGCTRCSLHTTCIMQALGSEPAQLLLGLRRGDRLRLRLGGCEDLESVQEAEGPELSPLPARARAVLAHRVEPSGRALVYPPQQLRDACLVDIQDDGRGRIGALAMGSTLDGEIDVRVWRGEDLAARWFQFLHALEARWGPDGGRIVHFGSTCAATLDRLGEHLAPQRWMRLTHDPRSGARTLVDLRGLMGDQLHLPVLGVLSLQALARVLDVDHTLGVPSTILHSRPAVSDDVVERIQVMHRAVERVIPLLVDLPPEAPGPLPDGGSDQRAMLRFLERERQLRRESVLSLQRLSLSQRVARSRALGPMTALGVELDDEGRALHCFGLEDAGPTTRFREGDFLMLVPLGQVDLQSGSPVILVAVNLGLGRVWLHMRGRAPRPQEGQRFSLEEDATDFAHAALVQVTREVMGAPQSPLAGLLRSTSPASDRSSTWVDEWLEGPGSSLRLESAQKEALRLCARSDVVVIEGPPGTGKTFLLGCMLVALVHRARAVGKGLRIAVTALTHRAIDQVLGKVLEVEVRLGESPIELLKIGRPCEVQGVQPARGAEWLTRAKCVIVGATGHGLRRLLGPSSDTFDWVVCDEASQLLLPLAWLALAHGRGPAVFLGDTRQLGPVVLGDEQSACATSILGHLDGLHAQVCLDRTHRLNDALCEFPSRTWYGGSLRSSGSIARSRLPVLSSPGIDSSILSGEPALCLVLVDHVARTDSSPEEAQCLAVLVEALVEGGVQAESVAVISPFRRQNHLIVEALRERLGDRPLPRVDTVERLQGSEADVVLYGLTASDPDRVQSPFFTDPRRFNVAITRARLKVVVVASERVFSSLPSTEREASSGGHLSRFYSFCRDRDAIIRWEQPKS